MRRTIRYAPILTLAFAAATADAQVQIMSAPSDNYLLDITRNWSRGSVLGDLRERAADSTDVEVRAWGGYGITRTQGIIARRHAGAWDAWWAEVVSCSKLVPRSVGDTASAVTRERFRREARTDCDAQRDAPNSGIVFSVDTLAMMPLKLSSAAIDSAWQRAVVAGISTLPPEPPIPRFGFDGFTYVLEVRQGAAYRASVIRYVRNPTLELDRQVQKIFAIFVDLANGAP